MAEKEHSEQENLFFLEVIDLDSLSSEFNLSDFSGTGILSSLLLSETWNDKHELKIDQYQFIEHKN